MNIIDENREVIVLSIARMIQSFGVSFFIVIIPIYVSGIDMTTGGLYSINIFGFGMTNEILIGIAISTTALVTSLGQPLGGSISDYLEKRKDLIIFGLLLLIVTLPFYLVVSSYYLVVLLRAIQGISTAILIPPTVALINSYAKQDNRGTSFGIYNTLRLLGFGTGPIIAGAIISKGPYYIGPMKYTGLELTFIITIITSVISLILVYFFVGEKFEGSETNDKRKKTIDVVRSNNFKPILALAIVTFLLASSIAIFSTLEEVLIKRFDQTSFIFGVQFSAAILANTISQIPVGRASDKYGRRIFIFLGFLILIPSLIIQGVVTTSTQMIIARLFQGISVALVFAPSLALAGDLATKGNYGIYLSALTSSFGLGIAVGPIMSGILYSIGGFSTPFFVSAILSLSGLIFVYYYVPKK